MEDLCPQCKPENGDIDLIQGHGNTSLIHAAKNNHHKCVDILIKAGADVNKPNPSGETAVIKAALRGQKDTLTLLIQSGGELNVTAANGKTPLIIAVEKGLHERVDIMLQLGADVNIKDKRGRTALMYAAMKNDVKCLTSIIRTGVMKKPQEDITEVQERIWIRPEDIGKQPKKTPRKKSQKIVSFFKGILPKKASKSQQSDPAVTVVPKEVDLDLAAGINNTTALIAAARRGHYQTVELLILAGAHVNITDRRYNTALMTAAASPVPGSTECIQVLLKEGAWINMLDILDQNALTCALVHPKSYVSPPMPWAKACILEQNEKLLFAAGEKVGTKNVRYKNHIFPSQFFNEVEVPAFLRPNREICLKSYCRYLIRNYLLHLNPRRNLFQAIPLLKLPPGLESYLLYGMSLKERYANNDGAAKATEDKTIDDDYDYRNDSDVFWYRNPDIEREVWQSWMVK